MRVIYLVSVVLLALNSVGQDPQFSQLSYSRVYLNPAYTGINDELTIAIINRQQWWHVTPQIAPFNTTEIEIEGNLIGDFGSGISLLYDKEGEGNLSTWSIGVPISYFFNNSPYNIFSLAFQPTLGKRFVDWDQLLFSDQLDPILGVVSTQSAAQAGHESPLMWDLNIGMLYQGAFGQFKPNSGTKDGSTYSIGFSIHNITRPKQSFIGNESSRIPRRYTGHIFINKFFVGSNELPNILTLGVIMQGHQKKAVDKLNVNNTVSLVGSFTYSSITFGLGYRNKKIIRGQYQDALFFNFSLAKGRHMIGVNYDVPISKLNGTWGTLELAYAHKFKNKYILPAKILDKLSKYKNTHDCNINMYKDAKYKGDVQDGMYFLP